MHRYGKPTVAIIARACVLAMFAVTTACAGVTLPPIAPAAFSGADTLSSTQVLPGVTHTFVRDARGPWAIQILEIDARICEPVLVARKPGRDLHARATTSQLANDAVAAVNADFFMLPRGTPVGAHVTDGVPLTGPTDRPVFAVTTGGWRIGTGHIDGHARTRDDSVAITQVNRAATSTSAWRGTLIGVTLYTAWIGDTVPADTAAHRLVLRMIDGNEARGRAVVTASEAHASAASIGSSTIAILAHGPERAWARRRSPGDTVHWNARVIVGAPASEAVGGFPELLRDNRSVLNEQTVGASFRNTRHPRAAIGWTPHQRLFLVVVDGRRQGWSAGMSLDELTWLFQLLGASHALNLDGGGSTAMVINDRVVNRPSDRQGERAVGNALALASCRSG